MPRIQVLPEALASQIAAGEVVERPASVVKELVENSLDAGARSISVLIEKSGKEAIRVADDGIGMSAEDARLALERHATSKLSAAADLAHITTLGFRGEALPSIASVSRFTLRTRDRESAAGIELVVEGGRLLREAEVGLPVGTIVEVRQLFFNVPARRKFLRADVTESTQVAALMANLAASFPAVHFRLEHGPRKILDAPPVSSHRERLYQIEGAWAEGAIAVEESVGSLAVQAWLGPPADTRGPATSRLHLFVNGRPVKDRVLTHAVLEAYRQVSSRSGAPLVYLFLELPAEKVDVNVHPGKHEVRFVDQPFVHRAVFSLLKNVLAGEGRAPELALVAERPGVESAPAAGESMEMYAAPRSGLETAEALYGRPLSAESPSFAAFAEQAPVPLGQFRRSFIVAVGGEAVWLVDQHAAHERILYEQLLARPDGREQQLLLTPAPLELSPSERVTLEEELERFASFGFEIEPFGGGSFLLRAVPAVVSGLPAEKLIRATLSEREQECSAGALLDARARIAARLACHAAIKIHTELAPEKMRYLLDSLWKAEQPTVCPHGRPTSLRVGREQVERTFGRI